MSALIQSRFRGTVLAGVSLTAIVAGMSLMEPRIHSQVDRLMRGEGLTPEMASVAHRGQAAVMTILEAIRDSSMAHSELTIFGLAAAVLLLFMFRI